MPFALIDLYDGLDLSAKIDTMVHNNENYESNHVQESQQNCEHLTTIGFIYRKNFVGEQFINNTVDDSPKGQFVINLSINNVPHDYTSTIRYHLGFPYRLMFFRSSTKIR